MPAHETFYEVMRQHGITRRSFLKFCSLTAAGLGLGPEFAGKIAHALETKPRTPVIWLHGLECTCCTESFIRSGNPLAGDVVLSMISLDYDDTLMAAAGHQAEELLQQTVEKYDGQYILACEGNPPLNEDGMYCIQAGKPYVEKLRHMADHCKAIIAWGSCASWGCVQAARPNPTRATPIHKVILDKPIIKVPGCPPIAEVMTGVITYMIAFDRLPRARSPGPAEDVLRPAPARQVLPAAAFRRRPVRRALRRRRRAQGLLPVQGRLQGTDDLQRLLHGRMERRPVLAGQVRPRLSRLRRRQFLGQGILLQRRSRTSA